MMTNLAHWQDDIDDALGGDFDGSLSGLCIMSLSFDFTRNGAASQLVSGRENNPATSLSNHQQISNGLLGSNASTGVKTINYSNNHDDSSNHFSKRFKQQHNTSEDREHDEENRSSNQNKIVRHLQQLKNCLSTTSLNTSGSLTATYSSSNVGIHNGQSETLRESEANRLSSPHSSETSCNRSSTADDLSRPSTAGPRSPTPSSQSCLSVSTSSRTSSRSQSPSDMSLHSQNNNNQPGAVHTTNQVGKSCSNQNEQRLHACNDNQQLSIYSVKDSLHNSSTTLKESSYTTSVITATAPMHFKNLHHPFSLKQFPLSPYHQFSNSSLNHDFYDRYLSHDSHQPLQTPLIGIERTQDLLSLKLPPHGPEETDTQRFSKEWYFDETKQDTDHTRLKGNTVDKHRDDNQATTNSQTHAPNNNHESVTANRRKENTTQNNGSDIQKGFSFNYKSSSSVKSGDRSDQHEPMDLNVSYEQPEGCCGNGVKSNIFDESMKHFNPDRDQQNNCYDLRSKNSSPNHSNNQANENENVNNLTHQYHGQESMFGIDPNKQKFQYVLAAPISVATKLTEDTMTYLNQAQAYEIKLENMTDVAEAKKGFMCSIINIGFHERHMQQAENELWQQWSQQHPNEKIFSVDMKLSYNVFGVESDGLNKYEFLWDSSKVAGVFIRINSISTEFTPKKHGGEKGVPFKLSIETFSYNSKTHDSFFISAACCQIKVFKPKGAERKIRSDRDKISKRPLSEQEKYHRSSDHTSFRDCSLTSLHPMADGSLCYYRHSHGHFASKQVVTSNSIGGTPSVQPQQESTHQSNEEIDHGSNVSQHNQSSENQVAENRSNQVNSANGENGGSSQTSIHQQRDYLSNCSKNMPLHGKSHQSDYPSPPRHAPHSVYGRGGPDSADQAEHTYGTSHHQHPVGEASFTHSNELLQLQQPNAFNQMYHHNNQVRGVASLAGLNNSQHFGMAYYGHHALPSTLPSHIPAPNSYGAPIASSLAPSSYGAHSFPMQTQQQLGSKGASYRQLNHDKHIGAANPSTHGSSFNKSSNLNSLNHNSFQSSYNAEQCLESSGQDLKESNLNNNGSYQHDNYDPHSLHHSFCSNGTENQPSRQRSASTSMATTNAHCTGYMNHGNQARHLEGYTGSGSALLDGCNTNNNQWIHNQPNSNNSQLTSPNSVCTQRSGSNIVPQNHAAHASYNNGHHHYECLNDNCDSEQNSPHKNHAHTSDSSSSCYSGVKNNSSMIHCGNQQDHLDLSKVSSNNSHVTVNSSCTEVVSWFTSNRFGPFVKTFNNFSGSDLLRLSKTDLIEICGLIDGIRLYNSLHNQPIKPRRVLYICHKNNEVFHPIYLYDLSLKELLKELSVVFRSQLPNLDIRMNEEKHKNLVEKSGLNSSSGTDSRSSMGAASIDTVTEDVYTHGEQFFNDVELRRRTKIHNFIPRSPNSNSSNATSKNNSIERLLIDGITPVKIVATEQVVQMLEDESVWTLSSISESSGIIEACMSICRSKRVAQMK